MLRPKQEKFCREYVKDYNGTQAWLRTYGNDKGLKCSYNTAKSRGSQLLAIVNLQTRIKQLQQQATIKEKITPEYLLQICKTWIEGYTKDSKRYKEVVGTAANILKDFTGITSKAELTNKNITTDENRHRLRALLAQMMKYNKIKMEKLPNIQ